MSPAPRNLILLQKSELEQDGQEGAPRMSASKPTAGRIDDRPRLLCIAGALRGEMFRLERAGVTLGRVAENDICIRSPLVSRTHAEIAPRDGHFWIRDCRSRNGTRVNAHAVQEARLASGDEIAIADHRFVFLTPETTGGAAGGRATPAGDLITDDTRKVTVQVRLTDEAAAAIPEARVGAAPLTERLFEQLGLLHEVAGVIAAQEDRSQLLRTITRSVRACFRAERACLLLFDADSGEVRPVSCDHEPGSALETLPLSRTIVEHVVRQQSAFLCRDALADDVLADAESVSSQQIRSVLCAPLRYRGRCFGLLYLDHQALVAEYQEHDLWLLQTLANQLAVWVESHGLLTDLRRRLELFEERDLTPRPGIGGQSEIIGRMLALARKAADSDATILILGESGTGKEVLARSIHRWSRRCHEPFVVVNCAALSDQLIQSDLFGHERGAFTGAVKQRKGRLELADGGTALFDEIGEMNPEMQARLLRFLQEREFERVGGNEPIRVDVRILAATHRDLAADVEAGRFREDLYYRLRVIEVRVPPLRERPEDIPMLAGDLLRECALEIGRPVAGFTPAALAAMQEHAWPGNVRELRNGIERAVVLGAGASITPQDLGLLAASEEGGEMPLLTYQDQVRAAKQRIIRAALLESGGVQREAAQRLGLQPSYLARLMKKLDLRD